uniref:Uncharacterized protein n=1 Tax=Anopheles coluzzii TaxID=1518534 RepID=A0A8W7PYM5_ANOCL
MSLYPGLKKRQNSILLDRKLQQAEYEAAVGVFDDADVGLQQRRNVIAPDWRLQRATLTSLTRVCGSSCIRIAPPGRSVATPSTVRWKGNPNRKKGNAIGQYALTKTRLRGERPSTRQRIAPGFVAGERSIVIVLHRPRRQLWHVGGQWAERVQHEQQQIAGRNRQHHRDHVIARLGTGTVDQHLVKLGLLVPVQRWIVEIAQLGHYVIRSGVSPVKQVFSHRGSPWPHWLVMFLNSVYSAEWWNWKPTTATGASRAPSAWKIAWLAVTSVSFRLPASNGTE